MLARYGNAVFDRIKMQIWMKTGMTEQSSCEVFVSPLPECIRGMGIVSDRGILLSSIVKQKAYKFALQPILI